jgi:phage shock protein PspC (stress-responsive transcriptional regulator)
MSASPPPSTSNAPGSEASPLTAFAWRHGLVRPVQGRTFAGVTGAFGRATNTDPVLWKVILVVLTFFGGIGLLIYLLAWLFLPADGDTATPVEALGGGRGYSRTSSIRTIVGLVILALMLAGYLTEPYRMTPLVAVVLLGGVLLLLLRDQSRGRGPAAPVPGPMPQAEATPVTPPAAPTAPFGAPTAPFGTPPPPTGVAPPFAPQGPFAPPPPVPPMPRWQPPPRPPRPRSRLGLLTLSVAVIVLGGLIGANLAGYEIAPLAYLAVPLAILGLGLLIGTWLGRARWLIPLGIVLMLALGGGWAAIGDGHWHRTDIGVVTLQPHSVGDIPTEYRRNVGAIELDLSRVDFSETSTDIDVRVGLGAIEITVPSDVDVTVDASIDVGDATVFDQSWDGVGAGSREFVDLGPDGEGGGQLHITAAVGTGSLEIHRER